MNGKNSNNSQQIPSPGPLTRAASAVLNRIAMVFGFPPAPDYKEVRETLARGNLALKEADAALAGLDEANRKMSAASEQAKELLGNSSCHRGPELS
jgi:hypothetical protein